MAELKLENSIVDERYYVERCLGRGSYAEIFVAFDQQHGDLPVIIKALNVTLQGTPDVELKRTLVENFQNEALALDRVRHPHIIRRLGHGSAVDLSGMVFHYLVLEYMAGGDLLSLCSKQPFTLDETLYYFRQVAEALAYAHSQQVIHRDIKPKNLLLSADRQLIKVADFGVAKLTYEADGEITRVGTDVYAPPEHHPDSADSGEALEEEGAAADATPTDRLTPSADVYALAKTIYTAMSGRAPRQFSRRPIAALPPELARREWSGELLRVLRRATARRAADRYATVQQFWEEFAAINRAVAATEEAEEDEEKTRVRARLQVTSDVERPTSQPNFQAAAVAASAEPQAQKARIVVELPARSAAPVAPPAVATANRQATAASPPSLVAAPAALQPPSASSVPAAGAHTKVMGTPAARAERNTVDKLRVLMTSDWLRRIFIIFLVATLIGAVASSYFYFAERATIGAFGSRDAVIGGAENVNLRAEPRGEILKWIPKGTKIRALEERDGWIKIRIVALPPGTPSDGVDTGWVVGRFVQFD